MASSGESMALQTTGLTARQREIAAFLEQVLKEEGRPPSRADIARQFGFNRATAQQHLVALERHGVLQRLPGARGIAMCASPTQIPIIGRVPAGIPLEAIENRDGAMTVPEGMFRQAPEILLRVIGDSMQDAGIFDGDLVAVVRQSIANSGDIVIARLDQEATVKRLRVMNGIVELIPENEAYSPISVTGKTDFAIEGVVVGVIRRL